LTFSKNFKSRLNIQDVVLPTVNVAASSSPTAAPATSAPVEVSLFRLLYFKII